MGKRVGFVIAKEEAPEIKTTPRTRGGNAYPLRETLHVGRFSAFFGCGCSIRRESLLSRDCG